MKLVLLTVTLGCACAQPPDIGQIMSRVARNQATSQDLRKSYVYNQKQLLRLVRGSGRIAREERREYAIMPKERGIQKELTGFDGKYERHGKYIAYDKPGYEYKGLDIDGDLIDGLSKDMTDDHDSRDGIGHDLFPLTNDQQLKYDFRLVGTETYRGRQVYHVRFEPKHASIDSDDGGDWMGDALIDAEEYQPALVTTKLAVNIPRAVQILLGTNIKGLGFSVSYRKFADGVWFPVSYGGEFQVRAVFFYKRTISISMANSDFRRLDVTSNIAYSTEDK
jgi:hypothetical protein